MVLRSGIILPFQFKDSKKLLMIGVPEENRDLSIWDLKNVVRAAFGIYSFEFRNKKIGFTIPDELLLQYLGQRRDLTNFVIEISLANDDTAGMNNSGNGLNLGLGIGVGIAASGSSNHSNNNNNSMKESPPSSQAPLPYVPLPLKSADSVGSSLDVAHNYAMMSAGGGGGGSSSATIMQHMEQEHAVTVQHMPQQHLHQQQQPHLRSPSISCPSTPSSSTVAAAAGAYAAAAMAAAAASAASLNSATSPTIDTGGSPSPKIRITPQMYENGLSPHVMHGLDIIPKSEEIELEDGQPVDLDGSDHVTATAAATSTTGHHHHYQQRSKISHGSGSMMQHHLNHQEMHHQHQQQQQQHQQQQQLQHRVATSSNVSSSYFSPFVPPVVCENRSSSSSSGVGSSSGNGGGGGGGGGGVAASGQVQAYTPIMNRIRRRGERMSKDQKELYVKFFEENPCMLNQRRNDSALELLWSKLANLLNSVPQGAAKNVEEWKQTFDAWRYRVFMYMRHNSRLTSAEAENPRNFRPLTGTDQRAYALWTSNKNALPPHEYEKIDCLFGNMEEATNEDYDY